MELPDLSTFIKVRTVDRRLTSEIFIDGASVTFYEKEVDGMNLSAGLHSVYGVPIHLSWGDKAADECSHHAIMFITPPVVYEGCIDVAVYGNKILIREEDKDYTYIIPEVTK